MDFDLMEQPWLPAIDRVGCRRLVGFRDLLLAAHEVRGLVGETPTMTAALYRVVLALAHRIYGPPDEREWADLWRESKLPEQPLSKYLARWPGRFDLFDTDRPFMQCPGLRSCPPATTAKLVAYRAVGNNATLFDQTTARDWPLLAPEEAARWLVTLHAYDTGGLKTPYRKEKSSERAFCNNFGCVLVESATLKETLLLNMPVYNPAREEPAPMPGGEDRPVWETEPPDPEPEIRSPLGWADLLTWPSRRVLLSTQDTPTGTVVDGVVITPGTRLRGEPAEVELMAAFSRPAPKRRATQAPRSWSPVRLRQHRGVWRHSEELLLAGTRQRRRPRTLDHLATRVRDELVAGETIYTLRVFGQQLDRNYGAVETWFEETVPAPVALLRAEDPVAGYLIGFAVKLADEVGSALRGMERQYCADFKAKPSSELDLWYWPQLSQPFGVFLGELAKAVSEQQPEVTALQAWARAVRGIARQAADRWAYGSPRQGRALLVAGKQHAWFTGRVEHLLKLFEAETTAYITVGEAV